MPQPQGLGITLSIQLDPTQYQTIVSKIDRVQESIQHLAEHLIDDPAKLKALTDTLAASGNSLSKAIQLDK